MIPKFFNKLNEEKGSVEPMDIVGLIFGIVVTAFIAFMFVAAYVILTIDLKEYELIKVSEKEIYSMKDGAFISGNFYHGTGTIDTEMNYSYYVKNEDGTASQGNVKAKDSKIFFISEGESPRIEKYEKDFGDFYNFFMFGSKHNIYYIYVPEGTIIEDYVLDAEG